MKYPLSFYLGIFLFSMVLGHLIGLSSSPVLGTAITVILGIVVAFLGVYERSKGEQPQVRPNLLKNIGWILTVCGIGIFLGLYSGSWIKLNSTLIFHLEKEVPWQKGQEPSELAEAIDWMVVAHKLKELGYTTNQVREHYNIRKSEFNSTYYDRSEPFHRIISDEPIEKENLGPVAHESYSNRLNPS